MTEDCDYLVMGCGAQAMAFVDVMLRETDATFVMADRRAAPGGHWNDAYPFVRLHQPSACYGVPSRELGRGTKDKTGFNKGLLELAPGIKVANYFHEVMADVFLPTGRVSYFPLSEVTPDRDIRHLLSGEHRKVQVRKKLVDATKLNTSIPLTHTRRFTVAEGVACIPPNDLVRLSPEFERYTVLGGGKTAIDSVSWLLANGAPPEAISWVIPRDQWLINRATMQPGEEFFETSLGSFARQFEICATAGSVREICEQMEVAGAWLRLDPAVEPTMFHGATVTEIELEQLRRITGVIRKGRVQALERDRIVLEGGEVAVEPGALYVDCTANALGASVVDRTPVFAPGCISLQMVRLFQPTFSAALIGHLEASIADEAVKQRLAQVVPMTDRPEDWPVSMVPNLANQYNWTRHEGLGEWIAGCRLDQFGETIRNVRADDAPKRAIRARIGQSLGPAAANLARLAAA